MVMPVLISPSIEIIPTAPPYQPRAVFLQILDGLRRPFLGSADDGHRPHVRQKRIQRIEAFGQRGFDVIDGVKHAGVGFDQLAPDHFHRTRHRDARLIVAVDVGAHRQLRLFLGRIQQLANVVGIAQRIARAPRGSRNGTSFNAPAFDAHEHLRRRADQLFLAQLQEEFVRAGTRVLNLLEQLRRAPRVRRAKRLAQHHFVIVALAHAFAHGLDLGHVFFGRVIADDRPGLGLLGALQLFAGARQAAAWSHSPRAKSYW